MFLSTLGPVPQIKYSADTMDSIKWSRAALGSAVYRSINEAVCTITEKAPTRAFSWLKAATTAFTFKTVLGHYAKQALTQW